MVILCNIWFFWIEYVEIIVYRLYELRVNLEDFVGNKRFVKYSYFWIGNEVDGYCLILFGYIGNVGKLKFILFL